MGLFWYPPNIMMSSPPNFDDVTGVLMTVKLQLFQNRKFDRFWYPPMMLMSSPPKFDDVVGVLMRVKLQLYGLIYCKICKVHNFLNNNLIFSRKPAKPTNFNMLVVFQSLILAECHVFTTYLNQILLPNGFPQYMCV